MLFLNGLVRTSVRRDGTLPITEIYLFAIRIPGPIELGGQMVYDSFIAIRRFEGGIKG